MGAIILSIIVGIACMVLFLGIIICCYLTFSNRKHKEDDV